MEICARLAAGTPEVTLCREPGMPSPQAVRRWAQNKPEFGAAYEAAKAHARVQRLDIDRKAHMAKRWQVALARAASTKLRGGGVCGYTPELGALICERLAGGQSVLAIGADPDMPSARTIFAWVRDREAFHDMYVRAREAAADLLFDLAQDIALESTPETVRADRLRIQTLRWRTAVLSPKKYGARRVLGPMPSEDGEGGGVQMNIILRNFDDPHDGPQYVDMQGNAVERPAWDKG